MATADVTVHGAGIFGLAIAWACLLKGAAVQVIDPGGPGAGASGGVVGALAPHAPDQWDEVKVFQFASLAGAAAFWATVAQAGGTDPGYARTGRLQPLSDDAAVARARARGAAAERLWQGRFDWQVLPVAGEMAPLSPTGLAIRDTLSARIAPRRAVAALTAAIVARGGRIVTQGDPEGRIVWATGHDGLAGGLGAGVKGQAAVLRHAASAAPHVYANGVYAVPHADGTVAIGSTTERIWQDTRTDQQLDAVIAAARAVVPALADAPVVERWAGIRPRAANRQPLLGPHPLKPGAFIANGGFKIGIGLGPEVGRVMADLLLDGRDAIPAAFRAG